MPKVKDPEPQVGYLPRYYTVSECAGITRRSVGALRMLRYRRETLGEDVGPRWVKVDGRVMVAEDELRRWMAGEG